VRMVIEDGRVNSIEGGKDAEGLLKLLEGFGDPNMYQVVEFGIGLNKEARIGRGLMAEDEGQFGTVHLGLGEGRTFGLPVSAPSHVDLVVRNPVVSVDGELILRQEQLVKALA